jgi:hypothetical protein
VEASGACDGVCFYGIMREVSEQHQAERALRDLLLSSSFDLRVHAQNIQARGIADLLLALRRLMWAHRHRLRRSYCATARASAPTRRRRFWPTLCSAAAICCLASYPT